MVKGGYAILDFKGMSFVTSDTESERTHRTMPDILEALRNLNYKVAVVSGLVISSARTPDVPPTKLQDTQAVVGRNSMNTGYIASIGAIIEGQNWAFEIEVLDTGVVTVLLPY